MACQSANAFLKTELDSTKTLSGTLCKTSAFEKHRYYGRTYRGIKATRQDISAYKVGELICNKTCLSTSKDRAVAEMFSHKGDPKKLSVICIFTIKYSRDYAHALDLEPLSQFPMEQEVIILPSSIFLVKSIVEQEQIIEIELESYR
jgi:hypothetical protein